MKLTIEIIHEYAKQNDWLKELTYDQLQTIIKMMQEYGDQFCQPLAGNSLPLPSDEEIGGMVPIKNPSTQFQKSLNDCFVAGIKALAKWQSERPEDLKLKGRERVL